MELTIDIKSIATDTTPEKWQKRTVGTTMQLINGCPFKPEQWRTNGTPIIRIQNLTDKNSSFNYFDGKVDEKYNVSNGDVLFAWSGTTGSSFGAKIWEQGAGYLNQHIFRVVPDASLLTKYYSYLILKSVQASIEKQTHGFKSSFVHVKKSDLVKIPLVIPPLEEQQTISSALSDMDALLAKIDQLIAKKRDIKQAAMQELLTGRRRLPGFSDTWKFRVLRDLLTQPATYGIVTAGNFQRTGIPMIRGGDIKNGSIGNEMPFVSEEKNFEYARTITQAGDVLICLVGYPGESAKVPEHLSGSNISRSAGLLRLSPQLDPDYLVCYLNSTAGRKNFLTPSAGSAQLVVNLKDLNLLKARFPEVPEQQAIASIQLDLDAEITALEARREKTRLIKQGMMQELLSGRVRLI